MNSGSANPVAYRLCFFAHKLDILYIITVDRCCQHPDIAAFEVHIPAAFDLGKLAFGMVADQLSQGYQWQCHSTLKKQSELAM